MTMQDIHAMLVPMSPETDPLNASESLGGEQKAQKRPSQPKIGQVGTGGRKGGGEKRQGNGNGSDQHRDDCTCLVMAFSFNIVAGGAARQDLVSLDSGRMQWHVLDYW